ncbi:Aldose 1-epimerase precursor [Hartmannibacter diazotrophicus]|uniref:Aldose 1-epimerase n=1 Tax=Hartmannibacter diazotrophicus TaxID=1482074 RepID=A0A2C9D072_9HYPH|nr:aldose epimerase family protein [Hartmannibacter diazotrophicus]SON53599.1 Aldose 1-epimerase precursor [Hartmannibacter diazotrophicus]
MAATRFGTLANGAAVDEIIIGTGGLRASILTLGAILRRLDVTLPSGRRNVVLGFSDLAAYENGAGYFGAVAGRCANRIAGGRFVLDGRTYALPCNEIERGNQLHGGANGFSNHIWQVETADETSVTLTLRSPDGEEGYPGAVEVRCTYEIADGATLVITLTATTDASTLVNLATHSYFNLDAGADILGHRLQISANTYCPVDDRLIPTGELRPVEGTPFDFREARSVAGPDGRSPGYDHNFAVAMEPSSAPRQMARLTGANGDLALEILSTEPGVQFYDGGAAGLPLTSDNGHPVGPHAGLCLEPQAFPNAINTPGFFAPVLRPGEVYRQVTEYRFSIPG